MPFGACHRSHASIVGPSALPAERCRTFAQSRDRALDRILQEPTRSFVAIIGGAKFADKLGVLRSLAKRTDRLLLGGAKRFTFLAAFGREVGASHLE
jgi:phosphoglycerate kinase